MSSDSHSLAVHLGTSQASSMGIVYVGCMSVAEFRSRLRNTGFALFFKISK